MIIPQTPPKGMTKKTMFRLLRASLVWFDVIAKADCVSCVAHDCGQLCQSREYLGAAMKNAKYMRDKLDKLLNEKVKGK